MDLGGAVRNECKDQASLKLVVDIDSLHAGILISTLSNRLRVRQLYRLDRSK